MELLLRLESDADLAEVIDIYSFHFFAMADVELREHTADALLCVIPYLKSEHIARTKER